MPLNLLLSEKFILDFRRIDDFVQGTGLGLTICRMLVEKMGGRIWVRSKQGEGTVFYFTLPMAK